VLGKYLLQGSEAAACNPDKLFQLLVSPSPSYIILLRIYLLLLAFSFSKIVRNWQGERSVTSALMNLFNRIHSYPASSLITRD
jgi:hypothetical protein